MIKLTDKKWIFMICLITVLVLLSCTPSGGFISDAKFTSTNLAHKPDPVCDSTDPTINQDCTPERRDSLAFAPIGDPIFAHDGTTDTVLLEIDGSGTCGQINIDWDDGTPIETFLDVRIFNGRQFSHTFTGWPGTKIVHINAVQNCTGSRTAEVRVGYKPDGRDVYRLRFYPNLSVCNQIPNMPPLRTGTTVRIATDGTTIQYGLPVFDASGDTSAVTPANFPFPGRRMLSLVYRVGMLDVQGEAGPVIFRVTETAPLEVCVNDHPNDLADNRGGMLIEVTVNEGSAIPPSAIPPSTTSP